VSAIDLPALVRDEAAAEGLTGVPAADLVQCEIARVDLEFHESYGRDESCWLPHEWEAYFKALASVQAAFGVVLGEVA
jgi:hypothetical protein